jgi:hypothetical protein
VRLEGFIYIVTLGCFSIVVGMIHFLGGAGGGVGLLEIWLRVTFFAGGLTLPVPAATAARMLLNAPVIGL